MSSDDRVAIVGAGRAGRGLARALRASGVGVQALVARRTLPDDPDGAVAGEVAALARGAATVLVAVQDAALAAAAAMVAQAGLDPGTVVLQLSGSAAHDVLDVVRHAGHPAGTFHPLVPLSDPALAAGALRGAWIGVGGDPRATAAAGWLAAALGARTLAIPAATDDRALYHAAAVIASNFPLALAALAERLLVGVGVEAMPAREATQHLMRAAVENLRGHPPAEVLTGPIVRGDVATVAAHLAALARDPAALDVYVSLSALAERVAGERLSAPPPPQPDR